MSKYAYVVGADSKYLPELTALCNSLDHVGNKQDLHIIGINLTDEFVNQLDKLNYLTIYHNIKEAEIEESRGISEVTCRKRYWYAAEIGRNYEAVCVLDADLIFCRDPILFFEISAKTGLVLGVSKEQNKVYDDPHHEVGGEWIWKVERGYYNDKDLCNCPLFVDTGIWGEAFRLSWNIFLKHGFRAPDMDAMNLCLLQYGSHDKTIVLPNISWLGTNEKFLKPYIRAVERRGMLFTESGEPIFSYHGHYHHPIWRQNQLANRHQCAEGYLKASECSDNMAQGSMNLLYTNFLKMLDWKIQIEKKNYRHPELPYEE